MHKTVMIAVAALSLGAATVAAPTSAEARCRGCWVGAGVAAGLFAGAAIANAPYYGYYRPAYYGYRPYYYRPRYYGYYRPRYYGYSAPAYRYRYYW